MLSVTALLVSNSKLGGGVGGALAGAQGGPREEGSLESRGSLERLLEPEGTGKCLAAEVAAEVAGAEVGKEAQRTMPLFAVLLRAELSSVGII